ncbi:DUF3261 domain-containing protein [Vibrio alfacsensis]|uniref:DUF3261 domain-containing protein n=1 Tax=Vibrio alfacsensis TaxID=1074311 RepID=UPI004068DE7E
MTRAGFIKTLLCIGVMWISGCGSLMSSSSVSTPQVLLSPESYGGTLFTQQLLTVDYQQQQHRVRTLLQVDANEVKLAGFSTLSVPLFTVTWDGSELKSESMPGLDKASIEPRNVMSDMMLAVWPTPSLAPLLAAKEWRLDSSENRRQFYDSANDLVMSIEYDNHHSAHGSISVSYPEYGVSYQLQTLQWKVVSE